MTEISVLVRLLILLISGLVSFGFALFVMESPYTKPIVDFFEQRKEKNYFYSVVAKGLQCPMCSGFWGGILSALFLKSVLAWSGLSFIGIFSLGLLGSAVSLCLYYLREIAFTWIASHADSGEITDKEVSDHE